MSRKLTQQADNPPPVLDAGNVWPILRAIFASSPDPIGVASDWLVRVANPALVELFGYNDESEMCGLSIFDLLAPQARDTIVEFVRRRDAGEHVPPIYTTTARTRDGREFPMEVRSAVFKLFGEVCSMTLVRDVSEEQAAPRTVTPGEDFYRQLFEVNTAVKLLISPTTGRVVDANQAAVDFYGWSLDTLRTMRITDINMLTRDEVVAEMQNARSGHRRYFNFRHRTASGDVRHVEVHSGPVEIEGESLLLSIVHDVTERNILEEQLRRSQRLEAIGQLAGGVAHDFNNLLTVMMSSAELVARRLPPGSPLQQHLDDLGHAAGRAAELTRDLLAFSRRQRMQPAALDLNDAVERMRGLLERTLGSAIIVKSELESDLPAVRADPSQIEQVVMNLALNARDAMEQGGVLELSTRVVETDGTDPPGVPAGRWVSLRVVDEGRGMDEQTRQRVFEPFFTTKEAGRGTGLGLSTVYGIVAQSGGHIAVKSEPGRGSEFTVLLPVAELATQAPESARAPAPRRRHEAGTVLLVDDMPHVRAPLVRSLEQAGFTVLQAGSTEEALALPPAEIQRVDAVVSDVVMPGRSGIELCRELLARKPELAVVLVSGDLRQHGAFRAPRGVRFLQKPFTGQRLLDEIDHALGAGSEPGNSGSG